MRWDSGKARRCVGGLDGEGCKVGGDCRDTRMLRLWRVRAGSEVLPVTGNDLG